MMNNNYEGHDLKGTILRLERSSIYDGDGYRTVVFMKGCPLRCQWCSTPESQNYKIEEAEGNTYGKIMTVEEVLKEVNLLWMECGLIFVLTCLHFANGYF